MHVHLLTAPSSRSQGSLPSLLSLLSLPSILPLLSVLVLLLLTPCLTFHPSKRETSSLLPSLLTPLSSLSSFSALAMVASGQGTHYFDHEASTYKWAAAESAPVSENILRENTQNVLCENTPYEKIPSENTHSAVSSSVPSSLIATAIGTGGRRTPPPLPDKLIVGYANWDQCDDTIIEAVRSGVNVVIWFAVNLISDPVTGLPTVSGGPNMTCVADTIQRIRQLQPDCPTTHLISIGGWNAPHPDTSRPPSDVYAAWHKWNTETIVSAEHDFHGFDGFDWDIEGNDDEDSPNNTFTPEVLDLIGEMSQLAKRDGYIVALAPMESYLDPTTSTFDRRVTFPYPEWSVLQPNFKYHGRNVFAYLIARYGTTKISRPDATNTEGANAEESNIKVNSAVRESAESSIEEAIGDIVGGKRTRREEVDNTQNMKQDRSIHEGEEIDGDRDGEGEGTKERGREGENEEEGEKEREGVEDDTVSTYDFITVQLYEGYSHTQYNTQVLKTPPHLVLIRLVKAFSRGWEVIFSADKTINFPTQSVSVPHNRLVVGLANGWAGDGKFLLIMPDQVGRAHQALKEEGLEPRGFAFWNILDEGRVPPKGDYAHPESTDDNEKVMGGGIAVRAEVDVGVGQGGDGEEGDEGDEGGEWREVAEGGEVSEDKIMGGMESEEKREKEREGRDKGVEGEGGGKEGGGGEGEKEGNGQGGAADGPNQPLWLAAGLNRFMKIRK